MTLEPDAKLSLSLSALNRICWPRGESQNNWKRNKKNQWKKQKKTHTPTMIAVVQIEIDNSR